MAFNLSYALQMRDKFSKAMEKANRASKKAKKSLDELDEEGKKANKTFSRLQKQLLGFATAGTAIYGFKRLISVGADFEESLLDLSAITGATGRQLDELAQKSKDFGVKFGEGPKEIATAMKLIASAKPELLEDTKALMAMTEQVMILKTAARMDMAPAAKATAVALNMFNKTADKAGEFINIMAAGAKYGSSEINDTAAAMLIAGGAATSAGLDFAELNAIIQTVAKSGFYGSQAGTAINAILARLKKEGADIKKIGLEKTFELIGKAIDSTSDLTEKAAIQEQMFGNEHSKVGLKIIENRRLLTHFNNKVRGTAAATEMATTNMKSFNFATKVMASKLARKLIAAFDRLRPKLLEIVEKTGNFFDNITPEQIDKFANTIINLATAFQMLASAIIKVGSFFIPSADEVKARAQAKEQFKQLLDPTSIYRTQASVTDVNLNINSPENMVQSIKSKTSGPTNFNLGLNARMAQGVA
jgi:TP901 family phage tail tape measure protein